MNIFEDIIKYSIYIESEVFRLGAQMLKDFINGYFLLWYHLLDFRSPEVADASFIVPESVRLSLLLFAAPVRRFLSISTYSTAEPSRKLRHIVSMHNVEAGGPLFQLRVWMVSMGLLEAVQESDVLWWAKLWVETLWQARGGDVKSCPQLTDFDWGGGFAFVKVEDGSVAKGDNEEKDSVVLERKEVAETVSSVIWLGKLQGERYREVCGRVNEILKSREKVLNVKVLPERPASGVEFQLSN